MTDTATAVSLSVTLSGEALNSTARRHPPRSAWSAGAASSQMRLKRPFRPSGAVRRWAGRPPVRLLPHSRNRRRADAGSPAASPEPTTLPGCVTPSTIRPETGAPNPAGTEPISMLSCKYNSSKAVMEAKPAGMGPLRLLPSNRNHRSLPNLPSRSGISPDRSLPSNRNHRRWFKAP